MGNKAKPGLRKPSTRKASVEQVEEFLGGATGETSNLPENSEVKVSKPKSPAKPPKTTSHPWEDSQYSESRSIDMLVPLSEPAKCKLKWLSETNRIKSQRAFGREVLEAAINKKVKESV